MRLASRCALQLDHSFSSASGSVHRVGYSSPNNTTRSHPRTQQAGRTTIARGGGDFFEFEGPFERPGLLGPTCRWQSDADMHDGL